MKVKVEFKKLYEDTQLPTKAHETDAGFDLRAHSFVDCHSLDKYDMETDTFKCPPGFRIFIKTGFGMAIPEGYEAQVRPRSGLALKKGITVVNSPGTIDSGFRAEVGVILLNTGTEDVYINKGERIAQMVIQKLPEVEVVEVEELSVPSERGQAGFGSTGK